VVFAGRLIPEKNPTLFVEACALVRERVPHARFFVLGEGPLRVEVMTLVRQLGLEACVAVGWHEHVESVLGEALVFVSVQRMDNYPSQALLEAMACGAAVVATDVGLTRKLVDETVGALVKATPTDVAAAVARLLETPSRTTAMGRRGRERVVQHHSMESYLDYLEDLYRSLEAW
jgi:glycosyltransferase involved in cell wall biosynthesis